jgi:iturin family lipopeptide synthetase A
MVPDHFIALPSLPLTANGKVDRSLIKALPLDGLEQERQAAYRSPATKMEKALAAIWENILQKTGIGTEDNFFELGGNSLKASKLTAEIVDKLSIEMNVAEVFTFPTIRELSAVIERMVYGKPQRKTILI